MMSPAHQIFINKSVTYNLGVMKCLPSTDEVSEIDVENADETHFVTNMENGRKLGFSGDTVVKYAEVVSGGEEMKNACPHNWWERWANSRSIHGVQECQSKLHNSWHTR